MNLSSPSRTRRSPSEAQVAAETAEYPSCRESLPAAEIVAGRYVVRFARNAEDLDRVLRLRFEIFNLELGEGLDEAYATGRDEDELDVHFHHLMIMAVETGEVVGTYRMQTAAMAARQGGFYSAGEFDLSGLAPDVMGRAIEVGRACVARAHRNGRVLHLLWRGLAAYLEWNRKEVLFGCCSLTSQDPALGVAVLNRLVDRGHLHPTIRIAPLPSHACLIEDPAAPLPAPHIPALFQTYLHLGAKICGPPALDPLFKTIDFLVTLNVNELEPTTFRSFFK